MRNYMSVIEIIDEIEYLRDSFQLAIDRAHTIHPGLLPEYQPDSGDIIILNKIIQSLRETSV